MLLETLSSKIQGAIVYTTKILLQQLTKALI